MNIVRLRNTVLTLAVASALVGCNTTDTAMNERDQGTGDRDQALLSMKKDAHVQNRSAERSAVIPRDRSTDAGADGQQTEENINTQADNNDAVQRDRVTDQRVPDPQEQVVHFEFDSSTLTQEAQDALREVASSLDQRESLSITIQGHTDALGPEEYNEQLSIERARSVRAFLESEGIDAEEWNVAGEGSDQPIASNENPDGRKNNRRVEIHIDAGGQEQIGAITEQ